MTNKMSGKTRAAIYVRVSSERQAGEDRVSIESQIKECTEYCIQRGYQIVEQFLDKEKYRVKGKLVQPSGQRKDRPAYHAMLKAARNDEFSIIVAWKEDRLYRGMYAAMPLSELLDEKGNKLAVELVKETLDHKMLGIKAALGKIESDNIRERMIMGRRGRLERGEVPGGDQVKYGYARVDKHLSVCEEEAVIVRRIFAMYIAGENSMTIRRRLNSEGVLPRRSKLWSKATIGKILTGEFYANGKIATSLDGEDFEIPCPPIIPIAVWEKAQIIRKGNKNKARNVKRDYLCLGMVYCACGWKCNVRTVRANQSRGYEKFSGGYVCQRHGTKPETVPQVCASWTGSLKVDNYVWNFVKQICSAPQLIQNAIEAKIEQLENARIDLEEELAEFTSKLEQLVTERHWVITQARKGRITEKDMEFQLGQIELQEQALRSAMGKYEAIQIARNQANVLTNWADQYLSNIQKGIAALEVDVEKLDTTSFDALHAELSASRFLDKFPGDRTEQLKWAILEEKRKTVRTLIDKVIVGKSADGRGRTITPICALDLPLDLMRSSDSGYQSLEYINAHPETRRMVLEAV